MYGQCRIKFNTVITIWDNKLMIFVSYPTWYGQIYIIIASSCVSPEDLVFITQRPNNDSVLRLMTWNVTKYDGMSKFEVFHQHHYHQQIAEYLIYRTGLVCMVIAVKFKSVLTMFHKLMIGVSYPTWNGQEYIISACIIGFHQKTIFIVI